MHITENGQVALTLGSGIDDIGIGSVYQRGTLIL